jgi:hypothetical protein
LVVQGTLQGQGQARPAVARQASNAPRCLRRTQQHTTIAAIAVTPTTAPTAAAIGATDEDEDDAAGAGAVSRVDVRRDSERERGTARKKGRDRKRDI